MLFELYCFVINILPCVVCYGTLLASLIYSHFTAIATVQDSTHNNEKFATSVYLLHLHNLVQKVSLLYSTKGTGH